MNVSNSCKNQTGDQKNKNIWLLSDQKHFQIVDTEEMKFSELSVENEST